MGRVGNFGGSFYAGEAMNRRTDRGLGEGFRARRDHAAYARPPPGSRFAA